MITFIVFNGPPYSGKTTIARETAIRLRNKGLRVVSDSFAAPMKHFIAATLSQPYVEMAKDVPRVELSGYSVREFLIDLSEHYIKPRYGDDAFGRWLVHRALKHPDGLPDVVVVDDSGFGPEFDALDEKRLIHVVRPGKDFTGDSRGYLSNPWRIIHNDGSLLDLSGKIEAIVTELTTGVW